MRILYGVAGEGKGHYTRSEAIIDELSKKHKVRIVAGGEAFKNFSKYYDDVIKISSLHIKYRNNAVSNIGTAILNISNILEHISSIFRLNQFIHDFKPQLIISDFELFTNYLALLHKIPSITIDNEHVINKTRIKFSRRYILDYLKSRAVVKSMIFKSRYHVVTSFFFPEIKNNKKTFLFHPILRNQILKLKPSKKDHIIVYQTSKTFKALIPALLHVNEKFIIYGLNHDKKHKNLVFKKFNEDTFFEDLASCKAVIINGGFTLMTEAIYLGKPVLSIPVRKQFEQILNATYLKRLGYGEFHHNINKNIVERFLSKLDVYEKNLKNCKKCGDKDVLEKVEEIIKEIA